MITFAVLAEVLMGLAAISMLAWVMGLVLRVFGWTLRALFSIAGVLLAPLWIVVALVCGLAVALRLLMPIALVFLLCSMFATQS